MHHSLPRFQEKLGKIVKSYLDLAQPSLRSWLNHSHFSTTLSNELSFICFVGWVLSLARDTTVKHLSFQSSLTLFWCLHSSIDVWYLLQNNCRNVNTDVKNRSKKIVILVSFSASNIISQKIPHDISLLKADCVNFTPKIMQSNRHLSVIAIKV